MAKAMIVECPACASRYDVTGRPPGTQARCRCGQIFVLPVPTQSASSLDCPKCGGNVKAGASACEFCEAELLVKACPRCFTRIFHGAKHCNACGVEVDVPANVNADGSAKVMTCPRCEPSPAMVARLVGDTLMDECPQCFGIWLDTAAVDRLVKERRKTSTQALLGMGKEKGEALTLLNPPGRMYVKCPECATIMNRNNFARRSGIIVDTCKGHGTWFDANELTAVVEFVGDGGIEASHEASMQKQREDLRREKTKIRAGASTSVFLQETPDRSRTGLLGFFGDAIRSGDWFW